MESIPMPEVTNGIRASIPEHLMLSRLAQFERMREFFIRMGIQNLAQARQGHSVKPAAQLVTASVVIFSKPPSELTADIEGGKK